MNAQKIEPTTPDFELLCNSGVVEHVSRRSWLSVIFGFLLKPKSNLTLEDWNRLEQKCCAYNPEAQPHRDYYQHMRWHL